jgi:hypothetical protein
MTDLSLAGIHWALSSDPGPIRNQARPAIFIHSSFLPNDLMIAKLVQNGPNKTASSRVNSIPQDKKNVCSSDMTAGAAASSVNRS